MNNQTNKAINLRNDLGEQILKDFDGINHQEIANKYAINKAVAYNEHKFRVVHTEDKSYVLVVRERDMLRTIIKTDLS